MKGKLALLAGAGIGYVLGTRDGRQRYEQLKAQAKRTMNDPKVQEKASEVQHKVADAATKVTHVAAEKVGRHSDDGASYSTGSTDSAPTSTGYPSS